MYCSHAIQLLLEEVDRYDDPPLIGLAIAALGVVAVQTLRLICDQLRAIFTRTCLY